MKIRMHPVDIADLNRLMAERGKVADIDAGSLKLRDVRLLWKKEDEYLTIEGRDITTK